MSEKGFVYAYRGAWTHPAFNNLREAAIWNFLYQNAFWQDGDRNFNDHTFHLKRGQIVVSVSFLAKGFGMTDKGVRVVIQKLEKLGMVGIQGANKGTIITICNYERYQANQKTEGEQEGKRGANRGQTEGDNKKELRKEVIKEVIIDTPDGVEISVWDDFKKLRKAKRSPITETAMANLRSEASKANITLNSALKECCARGWQGFKADWYKPTNTKGLTKHERINEALDKAEREINAARENQYLALPDPAKH